MLIQKESIIELRQRFKLNIYEVKIWTSLLSKGIAAASELAVISGVPRSRCYDVLESLEKKGFIVMKVGKPIKYIAVEPNAVMDRVKKRLREDAEQQINSVNKLESTEIFKELELLHKTGIKKIDIDGITNFVAGRNNINRFLKDMILRAKSNVTLITNNDGLKNKMRILKKINDILVKKKIKVKIYTNMNNKNSYEDLKNVEFLETRFDTRLVNVDNKEIFFIMPNKDPEQNSGVWVKSHYFVNSLNTLFEKSLK